MPLLLISTPVLVTLGAVIGLGLGFVVAYFVLVNVNTKNLSKAKNEANRIIENAYSEAKSVKKEAVLEAKDESLRIKKEIDEEVKEKERAFALSFFSLQGMPCA